MHCFFVPDISGDTVTLSKHESAHCAKVLRLLKGDVVMLLNGKGGTAEATIEEINPKGCKLHVLERAQYKVSAGEQLHIAIAPTKNNSRMEWFLEKATEIGISAVTPIICRRSERKKINMERLSKVLISALKQSERFFLPELHKMKTFQKFVVDTASENQTARFIASYNTNNSDLKNAYSKGDAIVLIGPEGDFSEEELELAKSNGYQPVNLGNFRLRTETAGIVACHTIGLAQQ